MALNRFLFSVTTNTLTGTTGNDILNSPGSVSTLVQGLQGNDTITLNKDSDVAQAGKGDDTVNVNIVGVSDTTVKGGKGADTLTLGTSVTVLSGNWYGGSGNDSIDVRGGGQTVTSLSNVTIAGNAGNDTINSQSATIAQSEIKSGKGDDRLTILEGATNSTVRMGKGADSIHALASFTSSSILGNSGFDTISASAITAGSTPFIGGGKGTDSISIATQLGTIVGGYGADSITALAAFGGGIVYGDANGVTTGGTGTGTSADGADRISFSAGTVSGATTVYSGGGNDIITTANTSGTAGTNMHIDGGKGADKIGTTSTTFLASNSIYGGDGHDTILMINSVSGLILGGKGNDSIKIGTYTALDTSVNGGAGNDTITVSNGAVNSAATFMTLNGGGGVDSIVLGSWTANNVLSAAGASGNNIGNVVYGSAAAAGDVIRFTNTLNVVDSANWLGDTQIAVNNARNGWTAYGFSQVGSIGCFVNGDDLIIGVASFVGGTVGVNVNIINGAELVKVTNLGALTYNASNFGFTVGTVDGQLGITFT
ncbi:beta strand repeat-containing protein [Prochlorococcus marinus]|uniref:beta strand repeat-containing protein n=1 Tax=Prochlorococcus marinus TaxID=1219 RepID=UPI001F4044B7|nr:hypothetical protein [Prochlorococcus marinus]